MLACERATAIEQWQNKIQFSSLQTGLNESTAWNYTHLGQMHSDIADIVSHRNSSLSSNYQCIHAKSTEKSCHRCMEKLWSGSAHTGFIQPQTKMFFPANIQWEELRMVKFWHVTSSVTGHTSWGMGCSDWMLTCCSNMISIPVPGSAALRWFHFPSSWSFSWAC